MSVVSEKSMLCYKFNKINLQQQLNVKNPRFFHSLLPKPNPFFPHKNSTFLILFSRKSIPKVQKMAEHCKWVVSQSVLIFKPFGGKP